MARITQLLIYLITLITILFLSSFVDLQTVFMRPKESFVMELVEL